MKKTIIILLACLAGLAGCEKPERPEVAEKAPPAPQAIFSDVRLAVWQGNVGVPGGVPIRTTIYKTINPSGGDDSSTINSALSSCPAGQVVLLAPGTFNLSRPIATLNKSNYTLRGSGQGKTILKPTGWVNPIYLRGNLPWPPGSTPYVVTGGATKGSNTITLNDTSAFAPDMPFAIAPNPITVWAHNLGFQGTPVPDTQQTQGVTFKVRSKTATTVTFDPPCPYDFTPANIHDTVVTAIPFGGNMVQGLGVESLTVELAGTTAFYGVYMENAWGCWVYDVEISHAYSRQMYFYAAIRCEVRHCYTHDVQAAGPNHEGITLNTHCSWNLFEDNVCDAGGAPALEFSDGGEMCSANVVAYNYCRNTSPGFWDISFSHGKNGMLNLAEGNDIIWFKDDGYFGGSSYGTLLRNSIQFEISLKHYTNYYTCFGNVLGNSGQATVYETEDNHYYITGHVPIYELGYPNIGNDSYDGTFWGPTNPPNYQTMANVLEQAQQLDRNVKATLIRHGDWDRVSNAVKWDPNIPDRTIPKSLYLSGAPAWWTPGLPWPPIGSDLNPMVGKIPARIRFESMGRPTPAPSATAAPSRPLRQV
jgi:hypothetical protein